MRFRPLLTHGRVVVLLRRVLFERLERLDGRAFEAVDRPDDHLLNVDLRIVFGCAAVGDEAAESFGLLFEPCAACGFECAEHERGERFVGLDCIREFGEVDTVVDGYFECPVDALLRVAHEWSDDWDDVGEQFELGVDLVPELGVAGRFDLTHAVRSLR
jgi:hypothetical protein